MLAVPAKGWTSLWRTADAVVHLAACKNLTAAVRLLFQKAKADTATGALRRASDSGSSGSRAVQSHLSLVPRKDMPLSAADQVTFEDLVMNAVASAGLPLSAVENPAFRKVFEFLRPAARLPWRKYLSTVVLNRCATAANEVMAKAISKSTQGTCNVKQLGANKTLEDVYAYCFEPCQGFSDLLISGMRTSCRCGAGFRYLDECQWPPTARLRSCHFRRSGKQTCRLHKPAGKVVCILHYR